ncbi:AraC family transcriptional regulator [Eggerthella sp. YY7918]|uniref:AraC family transcriptional regulator n=1 Tax=Eggerthella sp. (strain YY7918) TaxID=502558 RepID=UPI000217193B|nr:AraC family transcriptional regulator [Eggerthella sp. YY7918]BAK44640.1 araC-type DNA-binding domain-containing protein [Eggerthella sp. YY7918]
METLEEWLARPEVAGARRADPNKEVESRHVVALSSCPGVELITLEGVVQPFPLHFHDFWTIGEIVRGHRRTTCRGEIRVLGPGDLVLFGPGEVHGCEPVNNEPFFYRSIILPDELFSSLGLNASRRFDCFTVQDDRLKNVLEKIYTLAGDSLSDPLEQEEGLAALVHHAMHYCPTEESKNGDGANTSNKNGGEVNTSRSKKASDEPAARGRVSSDTAGAVDRARMLLETHAASGVTLAELSEAAGLSRYHLVRVFAAHTGLTPHRYLQTLRANRARNLLAQGVEPAEAAVHAGFSDQSHMTRVFKALFGVTPARYRATAGEGCRL